MSTQQLIYLASISSNVQFLCAMVGLFLFVPIIAFICVSFDTDYRTNDYKHSFNARIGMRVTSIILSLFAILLFVIAALIPSESEFYKIAGINEIEKANIDANGKIIQETKNTIDSVNIIKIDNDSITVKLNSLKSSK